MATVYPVKKGCRIVSYKSRLIWERREPEANFPLHDMGPTGRAPCAKTEPGSSEGGRPVGSGAKGTGSLTTTEKQLHQEEKLLPPLFYIQKIWLPLEIENGERKPTTVTFYRAAAKLICSYFQGKALCAVTPTDIQLYFKYLRTEHKGRKGAGMSSKTLRHQYTALKLIFENAEQRELIENNPMEKVNAPKLEKHPVEAFCMEARPFAALSTEPDLGLPLCPATADYNRPAPWRVYGPTVEGYSSSRAPFEFREM